MAAMQRRTCQVQLQALKEPSFRQANQSEALRQTPSSNSPPIRAAVSACGAAWFVPVSSVRYDSEERFHPAAASTTKRSRHAREVTVDAGGSAQTWTVDERGGSAPRRQSSVGLAVVSVLFDGPGLLPSAEALRQLNSRFSGPAAPALGQTEGQPNINDQSVPVSVTPSVHESGRFFSQLSMPDLIPVLVIQINQ
ncbi:hypothetical protein FQA47_020288 [Oryzias melastigma]|uniref:Uncharacterized protein n=1 Tax=Oryzias melastigma TaxID=30732 RepID=A0A834FL20_ORYME|nr:hypothetical protein FQA47_020288 [Oryzias melastigma]